MLTKMMTLLVIMKMVIKMTIPKKIIIMIILKAIMIVNRTTNYSTRQNEKRKENKDTNVNNCHSKITLRNANQNNNDDYENKSPEQNCTRTIFRRPEGTRHPSRTTQTFFSPFFNIGHLNPGEKMFPAKL